MSTLLNKSNLVKVSTKGGRGQKCPKFCLRGLYTAPCGIFFVEQTPGLFHNIGKIHIQILVSFATPGDKFAELRYKVTRLCIKFGMILQYQNKSVSFFQTYGWWYAKFHVSTAYSYNFEKNLKKHLLNAHFFHKLFLWSPW